MHLEDTDWCFPVKIEKEDTITMVLRKHLGDRKFIRAEVRGYDEGSRFSILFRLEPEHGPIRYLLLHEYSIQTLDKCAVVF